MPHSILQWILSGCPYDVHLMSRSRLPLPPGLPLGFVPARRLAHGVWATLGLGPDVASCLPRLHRLHSIRASGHPPKSHAMGCLFDKGYKRSASKDKIDESIMSLKNGWGMRDSNEFKQSPGCFLEFPEFSKLGKLGIARPR